MAFAKWVFGACATYGFLVLTPLFFVEQMVVSQTGRPISHPDYYYGAIAMAFGWQFIYAAIARDPIGRRWLIPYAALSKFLFLASTLILLILGRTADRGWLWSGLLDGMWCLLFVAAWFSTRAEHAAQTHAAKAVPSP